MSALPPPLPRRQSRTTLIIFLVIAAVAVIAAFVFLSQLGMRKLREQAAVRAHSAEKIREFQEHAADSFREAAESEDPVEGASERFAQIREKMKAMAGELSDKDRKGMAAGETAMGSVQPALARYEEAYKKLIESGAHSHEGLNAPADIAARRETVQAFGVANVSLKKAFEGAADVFRSALLEQGVPEREAASAVRGFNQAANRDLVLGVRRTDEELVEQMLAVLDLYASRWGHWTATADGELTFEEDSDVERYNALIERIQRVADEQAELQAKLLKAQARPR